mgnify:CR=1 FL=1
MKWMNQPGWRWGLGAVAVLCAAGWWLGMAERHAEDVTAVENMSARSWGMPEQAVAVPARTPASAVMVALAEQVASKPVAAVRAASQIAAETRTQPQQADAQYRGQRLRLSGRLTALESGESGVVVLMLHAGDQGRAVRMVMAPEQAARARELNQGDEVSVNCFDQGMVMGELMLADCRLDG